jgi:hypothetical protein
MSERSFGFGYRSEASQAAYDRLMAVSLPEEEAQALAAKLVARGFEQRSNKYRMVAGLPEGETALQALNRLDPDKAHRLQAESLSWLESRARDHYMHVFAKREGNDVELDLRTFNAFKKLVREKADAR